MSMSDYMIEVMSGFFKRNIEKTVFIIDPKNEFLKPNFYEPLEKVNLKESNRNEPRRSRIRS